MPYCTLEDILDMMDENEIIRCTDDTGTDTVNTDVTDKAIDGAGSRIDSYLAGRYTVPVDPVPGILLDSAVDMVIYKLYSRRGQAPDEVRRKYDDTIKWLDRVSTGKARIPGAEDAPATQSGSGVSISASDRIFSRDSLKGF